MNKVSIIPFIFCCVIWPCNISAQVINDDMQNAKMLVLNQAAASKTNDCTVEWNCVDESLTGKCIDYHNDQWFKFNSEGYSRLYINISNQQCRDLRGVQLVALMGEACRSETYQILTCVSLANQDDIYVELDSIVQNQQYYINIDGYLHDFCAFQIEVSQTPSGLPLDYTLDLPSSTNRTNNLIRLDWGIPDSLSHQIVGFEIYRQLEGQHKFLPVNSIPVSYNAYGEIQKSYFYEDSIPPNNKIYYKLAARGASGKLLLVDKYQFYYKQQESKGGKFVRWISIPLEDVKNKNSISIIVCSFKTGKVIDSEVFSYSKKDPTILKYSTNKAVQNYVDKILIKVVNNTKNTSREYTYDLWVE